MCIYYIIMPFQLYLWLVFRQLMRGHSIPLYFNKHVYKPILRQTLVIYEFKGEWHHPLLAAVPHPSPINNECVSATEKAYKTTRDTPTSSQISKLFSYMQMPSYCLANIHYSITLYTASPLFTTFPGMECMDGNNGHSHAVL